MAVTAKSLAILISLLALLPLVSNSDSLSSIFSPLVDAICGGPICGKGTCKSSNTSSALYECECDSGWKQALSSDDTSLKFLPCVIPNCTIDTSCGGAPAPAQDKERNPNPSLFDPCYWSFCGSGTCKWTSKLTHQCDCYDGYFNLFNQPSFPCVRDCNLGADCDKLGIPLSSSNAKSPITNANANNSENAAASAVTRRRLEVLTLVGIICAVSLHGF